MRKCVVSASRLARDLEIRFSLLKWESRYAIENCCVLEKLKRDVFARSQKRDLV
jgi:hypothetical protein